MPGLGRYLRLMLAFAKFGLSTELAFRANFLVKLLVEALWLAILILFYELIFRNTASVAGWDRNRYLFFIGCHYALTGMIESFFLENCTGFADLVRSGNLDLYLLKPVDEQFLITARNIDWSTLPNVLQGIGVMVYALLAMGWSFDARLLLAFVALFVCGVAMTYSFLLMLASTSVWLVRNQSLMEMWWLFTTLMRYPREIFQGGWASWATHFGWFFTFIVPVLLVVSIPVNTMVKAFEPEFIALTLAATVVLLVLSRRVFRFALQSYRSASS
jgi:ABC-2 type transport system permease protein